MRAFGNYLVLLSAKKRDMLRAYYNANYPSLETRIERLVALRAMNLSEVEVEFAACGLVLPPMNNYGAP